MKKSKLLVKPFKSKNPWNVYKLTIKQWPHHNILSLIWNFWNFGDYDNPNNSFLICVWLFNSKHWTEYVKRKSKITQS